MNPTTLYQKPLRFHLLSTIIPWSLWFLAAYLSHQNNQLLFTQGILGLLGLCAPTVVAFYFISQNKKLKQDSIKRLFTFDIQPIYFFLHLFFDAHKLIASPGSIAVFWP